MSEPGLPLTTGEGAAGAPEASLLCFNKEHNDLAAECARLQEQLDAQGRHLDDALRLLARFEFLRYGSRTRVDERPDEIFNCPVCGWPQGGHRGSGRYKGNAENTHEEGCSMYAVLHGQEAPRIANRPLPVTHPRARAALEAVGRADSEQP